MNDEPKILIAGCGTGQHAINTACRFKNCQVLAIDLSVASLAYAKRQSEELGVKNIDYLQADILDLSKLGREFDIIESVGALHHMSSPLTGWRILVNCLKHGGLMRLGLYSDIARKNIVKIRNEVGNGLIGSKNSDLILFRTQLILSNKEHHKQITNLQDFYSLSELRDLLFHTQEWRYNLSEIDTAITDLGLKFSGFEIENKLRKRFSKRFPSPSDIYNLDVWNNYEIQNPSIFSGMYQFWCQKA